MGKQLIKIFGRKEKGKKNRASKAEWKLLEDVPPLLCRVKTLTNFPGYEIVLPGMKVFTTDECKVTLDGKSFGIQSTSPASSWELLVPGSDVLKWFQVTKDSAIPKGVVRGGVKKGQPVYICQAKGTNEIGHAYMDGGRIWCSISDKQKEVVISAHFSVLYVEAENVEDEVEYGGHPNEYVADLEEMNVKSMIEKWEKEEKQEFIRFIELDPVTKLFPIPDGWEVLSVDLEFFDKYVEKLSSPVGIPKTLSETKLDFDHFKFWYGDGM